MNCKNFINGFMSVGILYSFFPENVQNKFSDIISLYYCTDFQIPSCILRHPFTSFCSFVHKIESVFVPKFKFKNNTKHFNTKKE